MFCTVVASLPIVAWLLQDCSARSQHCDRGRIQLRSNYNSEVLNLQILFTYKLQLELLVVHEI